MRIDIFSDVICPWCFIGKRKLERALRETDVPDVSLRWRAFQLNPDMPAAGMDRRAYLERKFGAQERASQVYARVAEAGRQAGIEFAFERIPRTPNTLDAHRLVRLASEQGRQDALVESLFQAYFVEGRDIGDHHELALLARTAGLAAPADDFSDWLAGTAQTEAVLEECARAHELGITGVPCFVFDGRYALSGAQPVEIFKQALQSVATGAAEAS